MFGFLGVAKWCDDSISHFSYLKTVVANLSSWDMGYYYHQRTLLTSELTSKKKKKKKKKKNDGGGELPHRSFDAAPACTYLHSGSGLWVIIRIISFHLNSFKLLNSWYIDMLLQAFHIYLRYALWGHIQNLENGWGGGGQKLHTGCELQRCRA